MDTLTQVENFAIAAAKLTRLESSTAVTVLRLRHAVVMNGVTVTSIIA